MANGGNEKGREIDRWTRYGAKRVSNDEKLHRVLEINNSKQKSALYRK